MAVVTLQFPSMDALHMALPVSSSFPSTLLGGYNSATGIFYSMNWLQLFFFSKVFKRLSIIVVCFFVSPVG
jgi:hypothetical protein